MQSLLPIVETTIEQTEQAAADIRAAGTLATNPRQRARIVQSNLAISAVLTELYLQRLALHHGPVHR